MKVVVTALAEADIERIGDYIAERNRPRALSFIRELRVKCETLADAPRGYPLVPRYEHHGVRRRPFGDYLIFYRVVDDAIEVLHVLHGAMQYEAILFPEA